MNRTKKIWTCQHNENHIFEEKTPEGLCPKCEGFSFLIAKRVEKEEEESDSRIASPKDADRISEIDNGEKFARLVIEAEELFEENNFLEAKQKFSNALKIMPERDDLHDRVNACDIRLQSAPVMIDPPPPLPIPDGALGLCILLMDASGSMFKQNAFEDSDKNRAQVVAKAAAKGIMSLQGNSRTANAYLAVYKFDHRIKPVFMKSIAEVTAEYRDEQALEDFFYNSMESDMGGETDINGALQEAYNLTASFLNKQIPQFRKSRGDKDYPIIMSPVTNRNTMEQVVVPNVRVFIYTDGMQYIDGTSAELANPFLKGGDLPDTPADILLGAFIGSEKNIGCKDLQNILSDCPEHDEKQFFLIKNAEDAKELASVFRMASGNSGFCRVCVKKEHNHIGSIHGEDDIPSFEELL